MRPKKKILVVDANEQRGSVLKFTLETWGFATRLCPAAQEAVAEAHAWEPELAILAWPQTGLDVCAVLHSLAMEYPAPKTLAIAETLKGSPADLRVDRTLRAPRMDELRDAIRFLLIRRRGPKPTVQRATPAPAAPGFPGVAA